MNLKSRIRSIASKIKNDYLKPNYVPEKYWKKRGKNFENEKIYENSFYRDQEKKLLSFLDTLQFKSVLEVGCGFGRLTKLLLSRYDIDDYFAIDISPDLLQKSQETFKNYNKIEFQVSDITNFKTNKKYDLVIGTEVLMHVTPNEILENLKKLVSVSNRYVVNIDLYNKTEITLPKPHCFIHQYDSLYRTIPSVVKVTKDQINEKQALFYVLVNDQTNAEIT